MRLLVVRPLAEAVSHWGEGSAEFSALMRTPIIWKVHADIFPSLRLGYLRHEWAPRGSARRGI